MIFANAEQSLQGGGRIDRFELQLEQGGIHQNFKKEKKRKKIITNSMCYQIRTVLGGKGGKVRTILAPTLHLTLYTDQLNNETESDQNAIWWYIQMYPFVHSSTSCQEISFSNSFRLYASGFHLLLFI